MQYCTIGLKKQLNKTEYVVAGKIFFGALRLFTQTIKIFIKEYRVLLIFHIINQLVVVIYIILHDGLKPARKNRMQGIGYITALKTVLSTVCSLRCDYHNAVTGLTIIPNMLSNALILLIPLIVGDRLNYLRGGQLVQIVLIFLATCLIITCDNFSNTAMLWDVPAYAIPYIFSQFVMVDLRITLIDSVVKVMVYLAEGYRISLLPGKIFVILQNNLYLLVVGGLLSYIAVDAYSRVIKYSDNIHNKFYRYTRTSFMGTAIEVCINNVINCIASLQIIDHFIRVYVFQPFLFKYAPPAGYAYAYKMYVYRIIKLLYISFFALIC